VKALEFRYKELVSRLANDFPDVKEAYWDQYISRWRRKLKITQSRPGWYEAEDYVGLRALGEAYRRCQLRGDAAIDYAYDQIDKWRQFNGN
jgi:hypothetical protein